MLSSLIHSPLSLPPEELLRACLSLIHRVFVDIRSSGRFGDKQGRYVEDMADAMHNVSSLIANYGTGWLTDEKFRSIYLRNFDTRWANAEGSALSLEAELADFAEELQRWRTRPCDEQSI